MAGAKIYPGLQGPDRGFARALASEVLRHGLRLDKGLAPLVDRGWDTLALEVQILLRLGAVQLWTMETAEHAAVSETVGAARRLPAARKAGGLVNAVLRRAAVGGGDAAFLAAEPLDAWPDWLRTRLLSDLGAEGAAALAAAQASVPQTHLTPKGGAADAAALAAEVGGEVVGGGSVAVDASRDIGALPGFAEGQWWVQDAAAALPARLLAPRANEPVLDLCAAPGGKTMQLAAAGAEVTAADRSAKRMERLGENLARTGLEARVDVRVEAAESESLPPHGTVLLDAPCSALGTLRRHPEGAVIKSEEAMARFPEMQRRLLASALERLPAGGRLIYCVCTPLRAEGRDVVDAVLGDGGSGAGAGAVAPARQPFKAEEAGAFAGSLTPEGDLLTLPGPAGFAHDAFYIARIAKG